MLVGRPVHYKDLINKANLDVGELINIFNGERFIGVYEVKNDGDIFAKAEFVMQEIGK